MRPVPHSKATRLPVGFADPWQLKSRHLCCPRPVLVRAGRV